MDVQSIDKQTNNILNGTTDSKPTAIKSDLNCGGAKEEDDSQQTFLDLINRSMQESAQLVRASLGRSSCATTREKALQQVAMLQQAKQQASATGK